MPKDDKFPKWFSIKMIELINDKNYFNDKFKELKYEMRACEKEYT